MLSASFAIADFLLAVALLAVFLVALVFVFVAILFTLKFVFGYLMEEILSKGFRIRSLIRILSLNTKFAGDPTQLPREPLAFSWFSK